MKTPTNDYLKGCLDTADSIIHTCSDCLPSQLIPYATYLRNNAIRSLRALRMRNSLEEAAVEAGCSPQFLMESVDKGLTVTELIDKMGPSGLQFIHHKDPEV